MTVRLWNLRAAVSEEFAQTSQPVLNGAIDQIRTKRARFGEEK
jgi:hypothetical protein